MAQNDSSPSSINNHAYVIPLSAIRLNSFKADMTKQTGNYIEMLEYQI